MVDIVDIVFRKRGDREVEQAFNRVERGSQRASSSVQFFQRALITLGAGLSVRQIIQTADSFTELRSRIRLVTDSTEELNAVQGELFNISQRSRSEFGSTAELYSRIARNADRLNLSQGELLTVTESVNQAIQISGVSSQAASNALIQLGQGLSSNTLRGDELRSVLEQVPRLAEAIAEGAGITVDRLRALGERGELTSEVVVNAIQSQADALQEEFNQIPPTVGSALTTVGNSFTILVGRFNEAGGAASGLAETLIDFSEFLGDEATFDTVVAIFNNWSRAIDQVTGRLSDTSNELQLLSDIGRDFIGVVGDGLVNLPGNIVDAVDIAAVEIFAFIDRARVQVEAFIESLTDFSRIGEAIQAGIENIDLRSLLNPAQALGQFTAGFGAGLAEQGIEGDTDLQQRLEVIESVRQSTLDSIFAEREARQALFEEDQRQFQIQREQRAAAQEEIINNDVAQVDSATARVDQIIAESRRQLQEVVGLTKQQAADQELIETRKNTAIRNLQFDTASNFTGLLRAINQESKLAALISIGIEKSKALAANRIATAQASTLAFASQLVAGDPTSPARGSAAAAAAEAIGARNAALIIASGFVEGAGVLRGSRGTSISSGGSGGLGSARAQVPDTFIQSGIQEAVFGPAGNQRVINISVERGIRDQNSIVEFIEELGEALGDNVSLETRII